MDTVARVILKNKFLMEKNKKPILNYGIGIWAEKDKQDHLSSKENMYMLEVELDGKNVEYETEERCYNQLRVGDAFSAKIKGDKLYYVSAS